MTRSQARELAFILLFEKTFTDETMEALVSRAAETIEQEPDAFGRQLALGAAEHLEEIDRLLSSCSQNWKLTRVSRVALSTMRLAVYEMLFVKNIPAGVSINEAIELTKKYAGPEDSAYVNGVLGAVARRDEKKPEPPSPKNDRESAAEEIPALVSPEGEKESRAEEIPALVSPEGEKESAAEEIPAVAPPEGEKESAAEEIPALAPPEGEKESAAEEIPAMSATENTDS